MTRSDYVPNGAVAKAVFYVPAKFCHTLKLEAAEEFVSKYRGKGPAPFDTVTDAARTSDAGSQTCRQEAKPRLRLQLPGE